MPWALALAALVAGCSEGDPAARQTLLVATLGDSVTAGSPAFDPDEAQRKLLAFGNDPRSQWQYWAARKDPRLEFRNCGVWGERTDQIARRLGACARGADVLVVQGGIGDIVQGRAPEVAAANLERMVEQAKRRGLRVAVADVLPWSNGHAAAWARIARLNRLVHELARRHRVPVLPFAATLADPSRPTRIREEWTADGEHPSIEGHRRLGELAFRLP